MITRRTIGIWGVGLVALGMLAAAHSFERLLGLDPCLLCLRQRESYWVVLTFAALGMVLAKIRPRRVETAQAFVGLGLVHGLSMAGFHVGVEQGWWPGPAACSAGAANLSGLDLTTALDAPVRAPSCADIAWQFLGLSMAAWNAIVLVGLLAFVGVRLYDLHHHDRS